MNSGVPWHVKGVGEEARETAQEAARRAGMSVGEWLDTVIIDSAREKDDAEPARHPCPEPDRDDGARGEDVAANPGPRHGRPRYSEYDERQRAAATDELAQVAGRSDSVTRVAGERSGQPGQGRLDEVSNRLQALNRQIEQLARPQAAPSYHASPAERAPETPHKLADVISQLDRRLDALVEQGRTADTEIRKRVGEVDRAIASLGQERQDRPRPPAADPATPLDQALVEIAERQRALDGEAPARTELPRAPTQELSTLEAQLRKLNSRIEGLRPCGIDSAVETLRDDLAEIGLMMKEAMPRRAVEALENEVRSLSARLDSQRGTGLDGTTLAGLERGLAEVRDALRALTPAESLMGIDETMRSLTQRIEGVAAGQSDPAALQQLESAIVGLRGVVSHVASNEALASLSEEVRSLSAKVDQVAGGDVLSTLEHRIETIADALQSRHQQNGQEARDLEAVVERLTGKLEQMQLSRADHAAVIHLEDRIARLVEKLDASDARLVHLDGIERGLAELLIHIEHQRAPNLTRAGDPAADDDALKRDVQRTQDSLEAVHGTLGHLVDRLAMIETGMRGEASPKAANIPANIPEPPTEQPPSPPEPPPRRVPAVPPIRAAAPAPAIAAEGDDAPAAPIPNPAPATERDRRPIDPNLPPDTPLEPGVTRGRGNASPAERIAASEAALGPVKPPVIPDPGGKTNFIAAARRAAQTATRELGARPDKRATVSTGAAAGKPAGRWNNRVRQLLVATSVLLIVLGSLQIAANLFSSADAPETEPVPSTAPDASSSSSVPSGVTEAPAPTVTPSSAQPAATPASPPAAPVAPAGTPTGRQSWFIPNGNSIPFATPSSGVVIAPARQPATEEPAEADRAAANADPVATGSVPQSQRAVASPAVQVPPLPPHPPVRPNTAEKPVGADKLPTAIGSGGLRAAAVKGDARAEYEIALRYAEGRGVPQNLTAAAEWFERAAKQGLVPAQFRLGGHYEKGLGVKKDIEAARRLYTEAAGAGNAKAMHNLAVLYAEGVAGKPDYQTAARWFRKAADYGIVDSQYNLGVLYARGIGIQANLAEAYKWFTLAARDGDKEAARKRDDVGSRLDQQSLMAARAAVQVWSAAAQPEAAIEVKAPAGGWDSVPVPSLAKRRVGPKAAATPANPAQ